MLAGGVATFLNPEPLAPFIDAFILGEAEVAALSALNSPGRGFSHAGAAGTIRELAQNFPGIYVPAGYQPRYHPDGTLAAFEAAPGFPEKIVVPHLAALAGAATRSTILTPKSGWGQMFLVETGRGCSGAAASAPRALSAGTAGPWNCAPPWTRAWRRAAR